MGPPQGSHESTKHHVGFAEAAFGDPLAKIFVDESHSSEEHREIGHSSARKLLLVSVTEPAGDRIRIISARPVTRTEQHDYEE